MDYTHILSELENASLFDLYRLQLAIDTVLEDPSRLITVMARLRPGMEVGFFEARENRIIPVRVLELRKSRVAVQSLETGESWLVSVFMLNLEGIDTTIAPKRKNGVDRLSLSIGAHVGFKGRDGRELFGHVIKLNPKKAKVKTAESIWNVPYSMLFPVLEGDQCEGEQVEDEPEYGQFLPAD